MLGLQYFSFSALWSPIQLGLTVVVALLYLGLTGPWRTRFANSEPVSVGKKITFLIGLTVFYFAQGGPIDLLGHLMFSAHMTSMALSYLLAPPLMLIGIPGWMIRPLTNVPAVRKLLYALTSPVVGVLSFNVLFSFYHMPNIHDYVMTHFAVHYAYYFVLLVTSLMMWWNVITPLPEMNRLTHLKKMGYIFLNGVLITPACALIIFAGEPLYASYTDPNVWAQAMGYCVPAGSQLLLENFKGPEFFSIFSPLEDQQLGGIIMKLVQELVYGSALAYIFFDWYIHERKNDDELEPDPAV